MFKKDFKIYSDINILEKAGQPSNTKSIKNFELIFVFMRSLHHFIKKVLIFVAENFV